MNVKRNKELEIKIVNLTDQLIQKVIASSLTDGQEKDLLIEDTNNIILELSALICDLIDDEEHLESMLKQLVLQKLPDEEILESFDNFSNLLYEVIEKGVEKYRNTLIKPLAEHTETVNDNKTNATNAVNLEESHKNTKINIDNSIDSTNDNDQIYLMLKNIYPEYKIFENYTYRGGRFNYFIPELKLAILTNHIETSIKSGLIDFIAKRHKLKLVKLPNKNISQVEISKYINKSLEI